MRTAVESTTVDGWHITVYEVRVRGVLVGLETRTYPVALAGGGRASEGPASA